MQGTAANHSVILPPSYCYITAMMPSEWSYHAATKVGKYIIGYWCLILPIIKNGARTAGRTLHRMVVKRQRSRLFIVEGGKWPTKLSSFLLIRNTLEQGHNAADTDNQGDNCHTSSKQVANHGVFVLSHYTGTACDKY